MARSCDGERHTDAHLSGASTEPDADLQPVGPGGRVAGGGRRRRLGGGRRGGVLGSRAGRVRGGVPGVLPGRIALRRVGTAGGGRALRSAAALADGIRRRQYRASRAGLAVSARHPRQLRRRVRGRGRRCSSRRDRSGDGGERIQSVSWSSACRWPPPRSGARTRCARRPSKGTSSPSSRGSTAFITRSTFASSAPRTGRPPSRTSGWPACRPASTTTAPT